MSRAQLNQYIGVLALERHAGKADQQTTGGSSSKRSHKRTQQEAQGEQQTTTSPPKKHKEEKTEKEGEPVPLVSKNKSLPPHAGSKRQRDVDAHDKAAKGDEAQEKPAVVVEPAQPAQPPPVKRSHQKKLPTAEPTAANKSPTKKAKTEEAPKKEPSYASDFVAYMSRSKIKEIAPPPEPEPAPEPVEDEGPVKKKRSKLFNNYSMIII